jgi:hypothetical protein
MTLGLVLVLAVSGCTRDGEGAKAPANAAPAPAPTATPAPAQATPTTDAPAPAPGRGVALDAIAPSALSRRSIDVNPFTSEARLVFATETAPFAVHLAVRVHPNAVATREFIAATRHSATAPLAPAAELGDGFVATDAEGRIGFALLSRNNVTCVARVEGPLDDTSAAALRAVVDSWRAAVDLAASAPAATPAIISISPVTAPHAGATGTLLQVALDPAAPVAYTAYDATGGASIVATRQGPVLHAGQPGVFKVKAAVATGWLLTASAEQVVEVGP